MKLNEYKLIFVAAGLIGIILIASSFADFFEFQGQKYSILFLLGENNNLNSLPSNIIIGEDIFVRVNVANRMESTAYYLLNVKVANDSDPFPNRFTNTPSALMPLTERRFIVSNGETVEKDFTISVSDASFENGRASINTIVIDGITIALNKDTLWNSTNSMYFYTIIFELWTYEPNGFSYTANFVNLSFNLTQSV